MKRSALSASLALTALVSTAAALPAFAHDGQALYRAQVLGERIAPLAHTPSTTALGEPRLVPGSYGRYLVYLGRSPEQAIAEARTRGEEPGRATLPAAQSRSSDSFEAYERYLGRLPRIDPPQATGVAQHEAPTRR